MASRAATGAIAAALLLGACSGSDPAVTQALLTRDAGSTTSTTVAPPPPTTAAPTTAAPATGGSRLAAIVDAARPRPRPAAPPVPTPAPAPPAPAPPAPAPAAASPVRPPPEGPSAYRGLGTWVDVYDWSRTYGGNGALVEPADIDRMAAEGVQSLYIQASKHDAPTDILEPERLLPLIDRARARGMRVVAWYLPTLVDPGKDLRRMLAIAELPVDSIGVDIEARNVEDVPERNRRLVDLSADLRAALPGAVIGAIVLPAVVLEEINPDYWRDFPYGEIAPHYDVWLPMSYWTNRTERSGYRDAHRYTTENIVRLRRNIGQPSAVVHPIGGIGNAVRPGDYDAFVRAAAEQGSIGASVYDWRTTTPDSYQSLRAARA